MKYNCAFCNQECIQTFPNTTYDGCYLPSWYSCECCNVGYQLDCDDKLEVTRFYSPLKDKLYCLDLLHKFDQTAISLLPPGAHSVIVAMLTFQHIIPNITPSNCQNKIETYITFS